MSHEAKMREAQPKKPAVPNDKGMVDAPFLALVLLLTAIGLLMMFSASYWRSNYEEDGNSLYYFSKQAQFAVLGLAAMFAASYLPCTIWQRFCKWIYAGTVVLLLLVLVAGVESNGARRWLDVPGLGQFQPSEVAKLALIMSVADLVSRYHDKMENPYYGVRKLAFIVAPILALILMEKHLSAIIIVCMVMFVMAYVGGTSKKWLAGVGIIGLVLVAVYVFMMSYAGNRITAWLHPEAVAEDGGYQILQAQYAIGSGGLFGLGFGRSRQKHGYLPFEHNDYIFPIVCEELGLVGAVGIIILFSLLILRGYWIAQHAANRFSTMLGVGITTLLAVQVVLNIGVSSNLLPSTGVGLPFFSYGGTNMLMNLGEMGIMLSISRWSSSTK